VESAGGFGVGWGGGGKGDVRGRGSAWRCPSPTCLCSCTHLSQTSLVSVRSDLHTYDRICEGWERRTDEDAVRGTGEEIACYLGDTGHVRLTLLFERGMCRCDVQMGWDVFVGREWSVSVKVVAM